MDRTANGGCLAWSAAAQRTLKQTNGYTQIELPLRVPGACPDSRQVIEKAFGIFEVDGRYGNWVQIASSV